MMRTLSAQVAATSEDDRVIISDDALIVLDGATSHDPDTPPAGVYVDALAQQLQQRITSSSDLVRDLSEAIEATTHHLDLRPGNAPSSTVAITRCSPSTLDILVLGDSSVIVNGEPEVVHTDSRLDSLELPDVDRYKRRLRRHCGYDDQHRRILSDLQRHERQYRNQSGGYWIAEADPKAAYEAITASYPLRTARWAVLATDGAMDILPALGINWSTVASIPDHETLHELLVRCHNWEATIDPDGSQLPRSKRHDDKTIAILHL